MHLSLGVKRRPRASDQMPKPFFPNRSRLCVPPQTKPAGGTVTLGAWDRGGSVPPLSGWALLPRLVPSGLVAMTCSLISLTPLLAASGKFPVLPLKGKGGPPGTDPGKTWGEKPRVAPSVHVASIPPGVWNFLPGLHSVSGSLGCMNKSARRRRRNSSSFRPWPALQHSLACQGGLWSRRGGRGRKSGGLRGWQGREPGPGTMEVWAGPRRMGWGRWEVEAVIEGLVNPPRMVASFAKAPMGRES